MTKLIGIFVVIVFLFIGWKIFIYWDELDHEEDVKQKKAAAALIVVPEQLQGMPYQLEESLHKEQTASVTRFGAWLKAHGNELQDPRKAWIELDYCLELSQTAPAEARRIYLSVKERTPTNSIIYPRIQKLEKTYQ
jgi:hypothetical protein